ncbi:hypothetical protein SRHO_G00018500 [Serrasalmus rhombeus]
MEKEEVKMERMAVNEGVKMMEELRDEVDGGCDGQQELSVFMVPELSEIPDVGFTVGTDCNREFCGCKDSERTTSIICYHHLLASTTSLSYLHLLPFNSCVAGWSLPVLQIGSPD